MAERVLARMSEQVVQERAAAAPVTASVAGQTVRMVPECAPGVEESALPPEYQPILAVVTRVGGPVMTRQVGETLCRVLT
ncbi:hypothetical protein ACFWBB_15575 [Streptomyces sp. NPDC060000]|uniref:hypothetical protein n=1 Tax=Streptomyces sp. NPDC060000 TaxID=3347031 RepID=UPI0036950146